MNRLVSTAFFVLGMPLLVNTLIGNTAVAADDNRADLNIEAQPLASALREFSEQTGLQIGYAAELAEGKETNGVKGIDDPGIALDALLVSSGLEHRFVNDSTVVIREIGATGGRDLNPGVQTPLAVRNTATQAPAAPGGGQGGNAAASVVTGKVTDASTGANLKGALVTIEQTGQSTSTDDLGEFRFASVAAGKYTLRVSYLGYMLQRDDLVVQGGQPVTARFTLVGGNAMEEIVVRGWRSARSQSLNQERTAEGVSTVISSDLIGDFVGATVSEALRRAPGVAFQQDEVTGDGTNIIIRGLAPDFNTVLFNGIELPEGSGRERSASLSNILADSIDSVTISKTLLPNQDSRGTGGLVEIETKSALDRPRRFAQFAVEGSRRDGDFSDGVLASAEASGIFGAEQNFGLGVAVQYRERDTQTLTVGSNLAFGAYLPLDREGGDSYAFYDEVPPGNPFPFEDLPGASDVFVSTMSSRLTQQESSDVAIGLNGEWQVADHTNLRFDYQRLETTRSRSGSNYVMFPLDGYWPRPVQALDGDVRSALILDPFLIISPSYTVEDDFEQLTDIVTLRGKSEVGKWRFTYDASYTEGSTTTPNAFTFTPTGSTGFSFFLPSDAFSPAATDPVEGVIMSLFPRVAPGDESVPVPLLSDSGFALLSDPASFRPGSSSRERRTGKNERYSGGFSAHYEFGGDVLQYVELGLDLKRSDFVRGLSVSTITGASGVTLADLGFVFGRGVYDEIGIDMGLRAPSVGEVRTFIGNLDRFAADGLLTVPPFEPAGLADGARTRETELAPYLQLRFDVGDFEFVGGARLSSLEIDARDVLIPGFRAANGDRDLDWQEDNTILLTQSESQNELLPRFIVNYRPTSNLVLRAGYYLDIARPRVQDLSRAVNASLDLRPIFGPDRTLPQLSIVEGNEALEPARTDNFDISAEYYFDDVGVLKFGAFYKNIENLLELNSLEGTRDLDGVVLPDFTTAGGYPAGFDVFEAARNGQLFVSRSQPTNNPSDAYIWGIELAAERQFTFLPGLWSGLGVYANYVYTESSKDQPKDFFDAVDGVTLVLVAEDVRFNQQPKYSGTAALTYNYDAIDANLIYSYQARRQFDFEFNGLSRFFDEVESLDFRVTYTFDRAVGEYRLFFEATDLLNGANDPSLTRSQGEIGYINSRSFVGGREFRLGMTASF